MLICRRLDVRRLLQDSLFFFFIEPAARAITARGFAAGRVVFAILLAPEPHFLLLRAAYAELLHLPVRTYLGLGELPVLAEDYVEAQTQCAHGHHGQCQEENFHQ